MASPPIPQFAVVIPGDAYSWTIACFGPPHSARRWCRLDARTVSIETNPLGGLWLRFFRLDYRAAELVEEPPSESLRTDVACRFPITSCDPTPVSCALGEEAASTLIEQMRGAPSMSIGILARGTRVARPLVDLTGFAAAWAAYQDVRRAHAAQ
jgi:hypothetical protein